MIKIFTSKHCKYCHKTKEWFKSQGKDFTEIDVTSNQAEAQIAANAVGSYALPIININGNYVSGYNPNRFEQLLNYDK